MPCLPTAICGGGEIACFCVSNFLSHLLKDENYYYYCCCWWWCCRYLLVSASDISEYSLRMAIWMTNRKGKTLLNPPILFHIMNPETGTSPFWIQPVKNSTALAPTGNKQCSCDSRRGREGCNEGTSADYKTDPFPYLWNSPHPCHRAGFASVVTTVVNSVYLFTISLLCQDTLGRSETIFSSQLGWLLWGGEKRKSLEKNALKENVREGKGYISSTLHPPSLLNTSISQWTVFFFFCSLLPLPEFFCLLELHWNLFEQKYVILYLPQPQLFAASLLGNCLTILPTQEACFGLIFLLLVACFNLLLWGLEASAYCKIVWVMNPSAPPQAK